MTQWRSSAANRSLSAQQARQAERGPTVRNLLVASTALAIIALVIVWLVFFRT